MMTIIHETHMRTEKSKERARAAMYWLQMTKQIEAIITKCPICQRFPNSNKKEPMMQHPLPEEPWCKIAVDAMIYKARDFLLIVDYFSKFVEIPLLPDKTATSIVTCSNRYSQGTEYPRS